MARLRDLIAPDVTSQRVQMVEVYRVGTGVGSLQGLEPVLDVAAPTLPPGYSRAAAERLAAQALAGSSETRSIEALGTSGDLLHAAAVIRVEGRRPADGRRGRDRLPDRRSRGPLAPHDAGLRETTTSCACSSVR